MSNPIRATSSSRAITSRSVPCRAGSGDALRGKNSYQLLNRARARSTQSVSGVGHSVTNRRGACRRISTPSGDPSPTSVASARLADRSARASSANCRLTSPSVCWPRRRPGRPRWPGRPPRPAPPPPASAGRTARWRTGRPRRHRELVPPTAWTSNSPAHRSFTTGSMSTSTPLGRPSPARCRRATLILSWPSVNASASTRTVSPTDRLAGNRPRIDDRRDVLDHGSGAACRRRVNRS